MKFIYTKIKNSNIKDVINLSLGTQLTEIKGGFKDLKTGEGFDVEQKHLDLYYMRAYYSTYEQKQKNLNYESHISFLELNKLTMLAHTAIERKSLSISLFTVIEELLNEKTGMMKDSTLRQREVNTIFLQLTKMYPKKYSGIELMLSNYKAKSTKKSKKKKTKK